MQLSIALLALFQSPQTETACTKLLTDFYKNEVSYTTSQHFNDQIIQIDREFGDKTGDYSGMNNSIANRRKQDERSLRQGDRIIALLSGQKCPLPDHVTSDLTFSAELKACEAARLSVLELSTCDFVSRKVAASFKNLQSPRKSSR